MKPEEYNPFIETALEVAKEVGANKEQTIKILEEARKMHKAWADDWIKDLKEMK